MLVHIVLFWLKPEVSASDKEAFFKGLESLKNIQVAEAVYVGCPAATAPRPVLDSTYTAMLTVCVKDVAAHDAYQADPLHKAFLEQNRHLWQRVQVYDAD
jgi:hypothetical protein